MKPTGKKIARRITMKVTIENNDSVVTVEEGKVTVESKGAQSKERANTEARSIGIKISSKEIKDFLSTIHDNEKEEIKNIKLNN